MGDALGTTNEFKLLDAPSLPRLASGPLRDIVGGGPFAVEPGQVTDDTHMAVCLADSIVARDGLDIEDVAQRYVAWTEHAFDIGGQTSAALRRISGSENPATAGRSVWLERGRQAAGNGSLMRTAPIGVFILDEQKRRAASFADSAITHFDPRCQLACAAFNAAIAAGVRAASASEMNDAAAHELRLAAEQLASELRDDHDAVAEAASLLLTDLALATTDDPQLCGPDVHLHQQQGFVRVAFRLAFWHLAHTANVEEALVDTVNRGGDADTNGAIVGALLGACHGEDALPARWRRRVLEALQAGAPTPLSARYHPRHFMEAVATWSSRQ